jgi:hypothetical protein
MTGKCIPPDRPIEANVTKYNMCEIYSWCPVEFDQLPMPGTNNGRELPKLVYCAIISRSGNSQKLRKAIEKLQYNHLYGLF